MLMVSADKYRMQSGRSGMDLRDFYILHLLNVSGRFSEVGHVSECGHFQWH